MMGLQSGLPICDQDVNFMYRCDIYLNLPKFSASKGVTSSTRPITETQQSLIELWLSISADVKYLIFFGGCAAAATEEDGVAVEDICIQKNC
jgi:hypothetical protein